MKKLGFALLSLSSIFLMTLSGCNKSEVIHEETIKLTVNPTTYELYEDDSFMLTYETNSTKTVSFSSEDTSVASISASGRVIAKTSGMTKVKATIGDVSASCEVTVKALSEKNEDYITFDNKNIPVGLNETTTHTINPNYYHNNQKIEGRTFTFESVDTSIATIDSNGVITAHKPGTVAINVTCGEVKAKAFVDVYTVVINNVNDWTTMLQTHDDYNNRFYLNADLDFNDVSYKTYSGYTPDWSVCHYMMGEFEGNYHTVRNIKMDENVEQQSIFGYATAFILRNIRFLGVTFTTRSGGKNCGLFVSLMHHVSEKDETGTTVNNIYTTSVNNVLCDYITNSNSTSIICENFYGGGIDGVFATITRQDDREISKNKCFGVAKEFLTWWDPNYVSNLIIHVEKGELSLDPLTKVESIKVPYTNVYQTNSLIEADFLAASYLNTNVWDVVPNELPTFR